MAKSQRSKINPPSEKEREMLIDYTGNIQQSFDQLFNFAHDHVVMTTNPKPTDGSIQDIKIVDDGTNVYLVVKTSRGWFKGPNFTAI